MLVRLGLVASKQSSLVPNCLRLTFFSGVNVNNSSKYNLCLTACSRFDFNSGFLPIYQRFFAEYLIAKSSFTQFSTIHRVGHCIWESSLNAGFWDWPSSTSDSLPRVGDVNISFPGVGVNIRFPRVGDVNISPGWVSSTSDQSQEWR